MSPWKPARHQLGMSVLCPTVNPLWGVIPAGAVMIVAARIPGVTPEAALTFGLIASLGVWAATRCPEPAMAGMASVLVSYFVTRQANICNPTSAPQTITTNA